MSGWSRREFLEATAVISAALASDARKVAARTELAEEVIAPIEGIAPAGELASRMALSGTRLTAKGVPAYSDEMVLADVRLDERRRFFNFSGDTSGRYVEALSVWPAQGRSQTSMDHLVSEVLANQRGDGRFGRTDLAFTAEQIGNEHMALLWGNGRMLVGLMARYGATKDPAALAAARKLADFLLAVRETTKAPEVEKRLEGQGAFGFICFTQLTEGLAMLGRATGDRRYYSAAAEIMPLLPPRGVQHAHGYVTTLRGGLMLAEATNDPKMLEHVKQLWDELAGSSDYVVDGSVLEYFGWGDAKNIALLTGAKAASGELPRNEGCGLADVIRLALQLYRMTGELAYLEQAERCYLNAFAHNQFATGDFGSRVWFAEGFTPTPSVDRAWWCCTLHGYRAYKDVMESAIRVDEDGATVQLFEDIDWHRGAGLRMRKRGSGISIEFVEPFAGSLRIRMPEWSAATKVERNGRAVSYEPGPYAYVGRKFTRGERVEVKFNYRTKFVVSDGPRFAAGTITAKPQRAAIYCGPYLMAADEELDPYFFSEPWPGNVVSVRQGAAGSGDATGHLRFKVNYTHDGFVGTLQTELRPMGEKPANDQRTLAIWLNVKGDGEARG